MILFIGWLSMYWQNSCMGIPKTYLCASTNLQTSLISLIIPHILNK